MNPSFHGNGTMPTTGNNKAPVAEEQLKQLATSGQLQPNDLVWHEGMSQWAEAGSVKGLFSTKTVVNPPSPPLLPAALPAAELLLREKSSPLGSMDSEIEELEADMPWGDVYGNFGAELRILVRRAAPRLEKGC